MPSLIRLLPRLLRRIGVVSVFVVAFGSAYRLMTRSAGGSGRRGTRLLRLLPEDGFGGPGVFERPMVFPEAAAPAEPSRHVEQPTEKAPAKKSAVKKSAVKKPAVKKSPARKAPAKAVKSSDVSAAKRRPSDRS